MQSLVRSMPDLHKTLILAQVVPKVDNNGDAGDAGASVERATNSTDDNNQDVDDDSWDVQELAIATEHAPFRHKKTVEVGGQRKRQKQR